jgi:hypothetical protein
MPEAVKGNYSSGGLGLPDINDSYIQAGSD